ncbi:biotin/lipoyl-binding protein [Colwellia demingiae]|uniref:Biotin/lipoyl-binding protein n=1 Tax=Colwellia demingiae TaxID=89401 RepID=A0A5C6QTV5_9GAMM|nr:efflux RND transporter periplasmic adaptor subunit [Colwellia demingiae]TWX72080.1 biotin/lipoyl-binding protein [Colwellia demingiae]
MHNLNKKSKTWPIILMIVALFIWLIYTFYQAYQPLPERIQGQIEAQNFSISSKVPGRIEQVLVRKGDTVSRGQMIFTLLSPEIQAKLQQAKAGEKAAGALAEQAEKGARIQEIAAAKTQWQKAKAANELMEKTYNRVNNLFNDGIVAEQKRDEVYTQWQAAKYNESSAYQMYALTKEGAREEVKRAAKEKENMAAGAVAEVEAYIADTKIESWHNGEVSQVLLQEGELAPQGFPVVTIVDINDAWAIFHIREDKLKDFPKGQKIEVEIPALGEGDFTFEISHISVMGDFATWRATDSAQGFDMRTFEVEARPLEHIPLLRVGMTVLLTSVTK